MKTFAKLAVCASLLLLSAVPASALKVPERLIYDVNWTGVKSATTVYEVSARGDELHIVSTTKSVAWMGAVLPVNDRAESVVTRGSGDRFGTAKYYRVDNHQGKHRARREAFFDPVKLTVDVRDLITKKEKREAISLATYDSLSSIYYVRSLDLVPGKSIYLDTYDGKKLWSTEVKVLRREEITTPLGRFKTLVVKPMLKADGTKPRSGDLTLWLTDDELRIPVMMTTKVKVGKITATLVGGSYWPQTTGQ